MMYVRKSTAPRSSPPLWTPPPTGTRFLTGAIPSAPHKLAAAEPFVAEFAYPPELAIVPSKLSTWGNDRYGDCVTAEEGFAKACHSPEIFIPDNVLISWASRGGFLNGAMLDEVLDAMARSGFQVGSQQYNDGPKQVVDYRNIDSLRAALAKSNVKIAMDHSSLPSGAGNQQGWYAFGNHGGGSSDHCTGLSGYGTAGFCFRQLGVALPSGIDPSKPDCFLHFTWSTIGVVDHAWLLGTCTEAWVRIPTTVGVPPIPEEVMDWFA